MLATEFQKFQKKIETSPHDPYFISCLLYVCVRFGLEMKFEDEINIHSTI